MSANLFANMQINEIMVQDRQPHPWILAKQSALPLASLLLPFVKSGIIAGKVPRHHQAFQAFILD
jgi:hypothetical protein